MTAPPEKFHPEPTAVDALPPFNAEATFKLTQPPNPSWTYGQGVGNGALAEEWRKDEEAGWKTWDLAQTPPAEAYRLLTSAVIPRPVAFVSSLSEDGIPNLAPFSYFSMISHSPPLITISISATGASAREKDTRTNILATKEFCVSIISEAFVEAANVTCAESPAGHDEWALSGLTRARSTQVKPAHVRESAVSFECELYHHLPLPSQSHPDGTPGALLLGLIKAVHVRRAALTPSGLTLDPAKLRPVARLGGVIYSRVTEGYELPRKAWEVIEEEVRAAGEGSF